jgi:hypothetical protein
VEISISELARITGTTSRTLRHYDEVGLQIGSVLRSITSIEHEEEIMAEDMFDGFDHTQYRDEVEQRWGARAWADGDAWWRGLDGDDQQAFMAEHRAIAEAWAVLRTRSAPLDGPEARALAARHRAWIAQAWGGRQPSADELCGLADMYVADERFAANSGGVAGAGYVRDALLDYALAELT